MILSTVLHHQQHNQQPIMMPLFVYGTLMAPEVLELLLGGERLNRNRHSNENEPSVGISRKAAFMLSSPSFSSLHPSSYYQRFKVKNQVYPALTHTTTTTTTNNKKFSDSDNDNVVVNGILLDGLSLDDVKVLDYFEWTDYVKEPVKVWVKKKSCSTTTNNNNNMVMEEESSLFLPDSSIQFSLSPDYSFHNEELLLQKSKMEFQEFYRTRLTNNNNKATEAKDENDNNNETIVDEEGDEWTCEDALAYIWDHPKEMELNEEEIWSYDQFRKEHLDEYLESTVKPCRQEYLDYINNK